MTQVNQPNPLRARLLAMMLLRAVLSIAFLGITAWFQIKQVSFAQPAFYPFYAIVIIISILTILYAVSLSRIVNLRLFTYVQVTVDIALVTVAVYITGGIESYLTILYALSVLGSGMLLNRAGGFYAATMSSVAYGVLIEMDFYRMLPSRYKVFWTHVDFAWQDVFINIFSNFLAFFTIAYLAGYLTQKTAEVEKELLEKGIDYDKLERLSKHVFERISSGIMTLDRELRITSFNKAAEDISGYTFREVYYGKVGDFFPGLVADSAQSALQDVRTEKVFTSKDGSERIIGFTLAGAQGGFTAAPDDAAVIVIFQDLTDIKAMEEQLRRAERLKALGELSVGIAHEIRNPLASISGSIQVLKGDERFKGDDLRLMDIVLRETDRLNLLITDFLVFAKPAQEKRSKFDLSAAIKDTLEMFRNSPQAVDIAINAAFDNGICVEGDQRQIKQVFWNMLVNAAHAIDGRGAISVTASVRRFSGGSDFAEVLVSDTGKGIDAKDMGRIFDPFYSTKDFGTGLGLAIAHRIVESHGGSIEVRSALGSGAVFTVTLPLADKPAVN